MSIRLKHRSFPVAKVKLQQHDRMHRHDHDVWPQVKGHTVKSQETVPISAANLKCSEIASVRT
jgi:hypothetical protein